MPHLQLQLIVVFAIGYVQTVAGSGAPLPSADDNAAPLQHDQTASASYLHAM